MVRQEQMGGSCVFFSTGLFCGAPDIMTQQDLCVFVEMQAVNGSL